MIGSTFYSAKAENSAEERFRVRYFTHNYWGDYAFDDFPNYYDLTFVLSGSLSYLIDGRMTEIAPGNAVLYLPGSHRVCGRTTQLQTEYVSINFFAEECPQFSQKIVDCLTAEVQRLLHLLEATSENRTPFQPYKQSLFVELILAVLREQLELQALNPHVMAVMDYVRAHLTEKLTLRQIAESVSLAPTYCGYLVKRELGITIFDLIIRERMDLAQKYIMEGRPLQEVCYLCGYNDYSYFSKHYKRITGSLPSKSRRG